MTMLERLFYDPQARADAREGLREMGRGVGLLLKWAAILSIGLAVLTVIIVIGVITNDWSKAHEDSIRWAIAAAAGVYGLWLLVQIRDQLARLAALLEAANRRP